MPERIGRYTVVRQLGSGGMGEVYLAYTPAGDPVAVKLIRGDRLDPVTRQRFEREALVARTVIGTNRVARFLDADPYADRPWLAMEYVPGRTLLECVAADGPLPLALVASLGALLSEGLAAVHRVGLLHRDLKPQNIIMGEDGPMVIDFGLAAFADAGAGHGSLSSSGMIIGTVRCMPPEQASGHPHVTAAADVYALGTVLLYAATGHYPYEGRGWEVIAAQVANPEQRPDLAGLPQPLEPLVASMLAHDPGARPALGDVGPACTGLLEQQRLTPVEARQALIARTASEGAADGRVRLTASLEDRLREAEAEIAQLSLDSPLDGAPGAAQPPGPEPQPEEPARPDAQRGEREAPREERAPTSRPRRRVAASQRIAEELRAAYAAGSSL